jgi:Rhs element Vgr protein
MEELVIPNPSQHDVASFNILVNDAEVNPAYQVISISISKESNRIPCAKIILRDGDAALRTFEASNAEDFIPGKKIKIKLGFDSNNTQAFKGIITGHSIKIKESGASELHIECRDETVRMTIGRHSRYFENMKDSRLFDDLIGRYAGLQSDPEATTLTHKELVQHHMSDWDFMLLRAEANGMLVHANDGNIKVSKPATTAEPVLQVTYGSSIIEFEAEMDARHQWKNVEASSWDYANQNLFKADTSEASSFTQHGNVSGSTLANSASPDKFLLQHSGHLQEQELQAWVDGVMLRSRLAKIRGRVRVTGFGNVKPGDMLKLEGVGDRFNGKAFITAVKQDVAEGTWFTHIQFGLDPVRYADAHKDVDDLLSAGLISSVHGLQIGKVKRLATDPDGEDRILVKIPIIDNNAEGIWVRVASLDAGSDRGAFFRPEIDDEVIVGFINDDPRHAVMLGMLHSSAKKAPLRAADANDEKGFFTRSNMRVHFNDSTKTITIDTPAGNSIKLDEQGTAIEIKDQNNNKVTLNSSGITLNSPLNVEIKAGANLTLSAGASLTIGAVSLSVKADGSLELQGAMTKLSSSGITDISGSLVKIN